MAGHDLEGWFSKELCLKTYSFAICPILDKREWEVIDILLYCLHTTRSQLEGQESKEKHKPISLRQGIKLSRKGVLLLVASAYKWDIMQRLANVRFI